MSHLPLSGIRVIDASAVLMGPYASQWLADFGAEVIKVEPSDGDSTRQTGPTTEVGMSPVFLGVNRNKKSIVINLKMSEGQAALQALIASSDVFMHNIRPQKLAALGLDPDVLRTRYPRLVLAHLLGFHQQGPYGGKPAYDDIIQGMAGNAALLATQTGTARYFPMVAADKTSGLVAAMAILAALTKRQTTGEGSLVEVPMFETMVAFNLVEHFYGAHFAPAQTPPGYPRVLAPWRRPYVTRDGHVCMMPYTDAHWQRFFKALGRADLASDERFSTMAARTRHIDALYQVTGELVAQQDTAYWLALCDAVDVPAARMNQLSDLPADPHLQATDFFETVNDPAMGTLRFPGVPVHFDGQRPPTRLPPRLGADTVAVLRQAGVDEAQIERWTKDGAVGLHQGDKPSP